MPATDELTWKEYVDFTGGLWERGNDRECAPNGLLECTDCFPDPAGGLTAFAAFRPILTGWQTQGGAAVPTNAYAIGVWSLPVSTLAGGVYTITVEGTTAPFTVRIWQMRGDTTSQEVSEEELDGAHSNSGAGWRQLHIHSGVATIQTAIRWEIFRDAGAFATPKAWFNFPVTSTGGGTTYGLYYWDQSTVAPGFITTGDFPPQGMWTYQNRILTIVGESGNVQPTKIIYTDPGSTATPSSANYILPVGEVPARINFLSPLNPSDLFFMKEDALFGSIQGALTAPTVRQLGFQHLRSRTWPTRSSLGLVMVIQNEGAYVWDGQSFSHISLAITGDAMGGTPYDFATTLEYTTPTAVGSDLEGAPDFAAPANGQRYRQSVSGQLGAFEHWVFFNNGYMLDTRTGAWFKQTSVPGARFWASDETHQRMYVSCRNPFTTQEHLPVALYGYPDAPYTYYWSRMGEGHWTPMHTYSFTLPLIYSPGTQTNVRELEYHVNAFNDLSTLEAEVTFLDNNGTQQTLTIDPVNLVEGPSPVRVKVPGHPAAWYKVRTIMKSNREGVAAPSLERMFCGTQPTTRLKAS